MHCTRPLGLKTGKREASSALLCSSLDLLAAFLRGTFCMAAAIYSPGGDEVQQVGMALGNFEV